MERVWLYGRKHSSMKQLNQQIVELHEMASQQGKTVVGLSTDEEDGPLRFRPGIREMRQMIRTGRIQTVMVARLTSLSHDRRRLLRLLKEMQAHGVKLQTGHTQLAYELNEYGLECPLRKRAHRFDDFLPW